MIENDGDFVELTDEEYAEEMMLEEETRRNETNYEIARVLLEDLDPSISDSEIQYIWEKCKGNPYNAPILYQLIKQK